jgi:hypothetical protein
MKLYMGIADAWDLAFRSFLVFIFAGLLWLKFIDPIISCAIGFPIPVLVGLFFFYRGWLNAKKDWIKENLEWEDLEEQLEVN